MNDVAAGKVRNIRDCVQRVRAVDPGTFEGIERGSNPRAGWRTR